MPETKPRKNVLVLHTDQERADSLGCAGNRFARTPNLDRLAAEGTLFTRHVATCPICSPSRASLLTGLYPPGHNLWCNGVALNRREYASVNSFQEGVSFESPAGFVPEPLTMADIFARAGYDTACFGKLHLTPYLAPAHLRFPESFASWKEGMFEEWNGPYYGFRHAEFTLGHGPQAGLRGHYGAWLRESYPDVVRELARGRYRGPDELRDLFPSPIPSEAHYSSWLTARFLAWLRDRKETPFFAFIGFPDPHHPFTPSFDIAAEFEDTEVPEPADPEGRGVKGSPLEHLAQHRIHRMPREVLRRAQRYTNALVFQIDRAVGVILEGLTALGLADSTVVVFTSDHGDFLGDHGYIRKAFAASDSLLRVPLIVGAPGGGLPPLVTMPVSSCDLLPTIARLAGVAPPDCLHGEDIVRLLAQGARHEAFAFSHNGDRQWTNYTMYDERFRFTWYPGQDFVELFDHSADPWEMTNLAGQSAFRDYIEAAKRRVADNLAVWYNPVQARFCAW